MRIKQPFLFGAIGYPLLELAFRGRSHWTMGLLGGASMQLMAKLSRTRLSLLPAALLSSMGITAMEFVAGFVLNCKLKRKIWDYSQQKYQLKGQICLPYSLLWTAMSLPILYRLRK